MKFKTEGQLVKECVEDGGQAVICDRLNFITQNSDDENGMSVTIQSWDEDTIHTDLNLLLNKKVRITIEVID